MQFVAGTHRLYQYITQGELHRLDARRMVDQMSQLCAKVRDRPVLRPLGTPSPLQTPRGPSGPPRCTLHVPPPGFPTVTLSHGASDPTHGHRYMGIIGGMPYAQGTAVPLNPNGPDI
ncbi:hypothetical protein KEM55_003228 [Ascosphaera atra]|nr:hypothetical protein KEM55_003228 [Ascosphaera atra]